MLPIAFHSRDVHAPASDTAAVVTYAAQSGRAHVIAGFAWSYDGAPTGGSIKIEDGSGNIVFGPHAITAAGPGCMVFGGLRQGSFGTAMIVTLATGGSGVTGCLTVFDHFSTPNGCIDISDEYLGRGMFAFDQRDNSGLVPILHGLY